MWRFNTECRLTTSVWLISLHSGTNALVKAVVLKDSTYSALTAILYCTIKSFQNKLCYLTFLCLLHTNLRLQFLFTFINLSVIWCVYIKLSGQSVVHWGWHSTHVHIVMIINSKNKGGGSMFLWNIGIHARNKEEKGCFVETGRNKYASKMLIWKMSSHGSSKDGGCMFFWNVGTLARSTAEEHNVLVKCLFLW